MSATVLESALTVSQVFLCLAMGCAVLRLVSGPRAQDRVLGRRQCLRGRHVALTPGFAG